jgi:hypothetical protein
MKCEHHTRDLIVLPRGLYGITDWCKRCGAIRTEHPTNPERVGSEWHHPTHVEFTDKYRRQPWATEDAA